jgi:signal transduction histidine kinase/DNA-binding response OmpR family regulator
MNALLRLLIVEDDDADAELVRLELERAGYELEWTRVDTESALREALTQEPWDLIISDFAMPRFDGLRAFEIFQQLRLDTPFIFVSGALGEQRAVDAMRAGARDYFLKGNLTRLSAAVQRELAEAASRAHRARAEEAAKREQRRLAMAVAASGAGVFEHTVPPGPSSYFSDRWAEILGHVPSDLPDPARMLEWIVERVHPDDHDVVTGAYEDFVAGREESLAVDGRMRHRAGHYVDVSIYGKALSRDTAGVATHVVGVMMDVTDRTKLEEQLLQAQKMEAIGRLAGGVAHDFNNILTAIFSFGSFVLEELSPGSAPHEDMQEILKAARKAEALTSQLLAFSRRKPISPKTININTLVSDMDRMLRRVVGEDVDVATSLAPDLWNVRVDPGSLEQVLVNLAVNGRDAMPKGGKLTIETRNTLLDEEYARAHGEHVKPGQYVCVAVSDDGTGMDEETRRHVFEPFFTTKEAGKGTGLGLSTCFGIVQQAGGYIRVYSEVGSGTTFRVYLPCTREQAESLEPDVVPESLRGHETVLVAEDDEQVRRLSVRALESFGYQVLEAPDGKQALALIRATERPIHLLLTDVVMPEMGGRELADELVAASPDLRVLYMSGYTANAIAHRGVLEPGTHLIQKPFTPDQLARAVRAALDS